MLNSSRTAWLTVVIHHTAVDPTRDDPADRVTPADAAKSEATAAACERAGNRSFRLVHELEPVLGANVRWLPVPVPPALDGDLTASLRIPMGDRTWVSCGEQA